MILLAAISLLFLTKVDRGYDSLSLISCSPSASSPRSYLSSFWAIPACRSLSFCSCEYPGPRLPRLWAIFITNSMGPTQVGRVVDFGLSIVDFGRLVFFGHMARSMLLVSFGFLTLLPLSRDCIWDSLFDFTCNRRFGYWDPHLKGGCFNFRELGP